MAFACHAIYPSSVSAPLLALAASCASLAGFGDDLSVALATPLLLVNLCSVQDYFLLLVSRFKKRQSGSSDRPMARPTDSISQHLPAIRDVTTTPPPHSHSHSEPMTKFSRQLDVILINAALRVVVYDNNSPLLGNESNKRAEDELHF